MKSPSSLRLIHESIPPSALGDIEMICVNDGSPDGSHEIPTKRQKEDTHIVIADRTNIGLSSARNAGMAAYCGALTPSQATENTPDQRLASHNLHCSRARTGRLCRSLRPCPRKGHPHISSAYTSIRYSRIVPWLSTRSKPGVSSVIDRMPFQSSSSNLPA